jgi:pimeloyl-ACP methyl ester carboxylesterase
MKIRLLIDAISILLLALLSGCASLQGSITEKVNNRQVEYALVKHDAETVVFENGLGGKINWWAKVFPEISKDSTAFAYNRPGYGKSDTITAPRDGIHVVDELRSLLRSKDLHPPYILVGHSLGGLYMQLFARRYPGEVSALVLVDSTHPDQFKGKGSPEKWPAWFRAAFNIWLSAVEKEEFNAIDSTGESVLSLPPFAGGPVIVLSALQPLKEKTELADYTNEKRKDIARLYPGSRQIWVDSGHGIPLKKPESVVCAIREVIKLTQSNCPLVK